MEFLSDLTGKAAPKGGKSRKKWARHVPAAARQPPRTTWPTGELVWESHTISIKLREPKTTKNHKKPSLSASVEIWYEYRTSILSHCLSVVTDILCWVGLSRIV